MTLFHLCLFLATIIYPSVSKLSNGGVFNSGQGTGIYADIYTWEDDVPLLWDDGVAITIYG